MAFMQPVWSRVDEAHHFDFIVQLSHGIYPVGNQTLIDSKTLGLMQLNGAYRAFYPVGSYPTPDLSDMSTPPPGMSDRADAAWMARHLWQLSQEAIQPPLYYAAMVPVWWLGVSFGGPLAGVYLLRLVNALIAATLAPMAYALARLVVPATPRVAVAAAAVAALVPGFALNGSRISNDTLAAAIGGLIILLAAYWAPTGWSWRRAFVMGVLLGAGMLVKVTLVGLIPALVISSVWAGRSHSWMSALARSALATAIGVAFLLPWFALNEKFYGALMPNASLRLSDTLPTAFTPSLAALNLSVFDLTFWTGEPWGVLPLAAPFAVIATLVALMGVAGVVRAARSSDVVIERGPLSISIVATLGMVGLSLLLPVLAAFEFVAPGRYGYPALPAVAVVCAVGVFAVFAGAAARRSVVAIYAVAALLVLGLGASGLPAPQSPGSGSPPAQARSVDVTASQTLSGLTVTIDHVAFDRQAGATWFHTTATNAGATEVEWSPAPVAYAGDASAIGDYLKSTHLPGDLDPAQSVSGWLYTPLDPSVVHPGDMLRLRFENVAPIDYRTIGNLDVMVRVPA